MLRRTATPAEEPAAASEPAAAQEPAAAGNAGTVEQPAGAETPAGAERPVAARRDATAGSGGAVAGAAAAGTAAVGTLFVGLGRVVRIVAGLIFLLIAVAILLYDLKANGSNSIVKAIHNGAKFFANPFNDIFNPKGLRTKLTLNWGIAAVVYLVAGAIIAAIIATPGHGMRRVRRRRV
jgi:hypothetical protein